MIDLISTVRFKPSYPKLNEFVSMSQYGKRTIAFVEYADSVRTIDMETVAMRASEAVQLQAFIAAARSGMETIVYRPTHICLPRAYWGDPTNSHITGTASLGAVTNGRTLRILNVAPGLTLMSGDLISFTSGTYRQMAQIVIGATAANTGMTVTVDQPVAGYIAASATVRFLKPELNTRLVPGSFQMSVGPFPTASFQLTEVPK